MRPPFCPNPHCVLHTITPPEQLWYHRYGTHYTTSAGTIQRFRCKACGKSFSERTFSIDRLARNLITFHESQLASLRLAEDFVADGFETFTHSQYFPEEITIVVGKTSQFLYFFNHITVKRKGRTTEKQKRIMNQLYRSVTFEPRGVENRFHQLLQCVAALIESERTRHISFYTDEKLEYRRALNKTPSLMRRIAQGLFAHIRIPSTRERTTSNPLFAVNYYDREFRKDLANHHRETLCFSRNVAASLMRFVVYGFFHNYCKPFRIDNAPQNRPTHAQMAGSKVERIGKDAAVFRDRAFLSLTRLSSIGLQLWKKSSRTPLKQKQEYLPDYVLA